MSAAESHFPVYRVDPLEGVGWDAALAASPAASFFHGSAWARVLCDTYGFRPFYFLSGDPARIQGLLPMMEVDSWLTGIRGVSLPFTDECEPLASDAGAFRALFDAALACARARGWKYLELRGGQTELANSIASTSFLGHRLELQRDEAALFARTESSTKRAVRKAEQGGLTIEFSRSLETVRAFYGLLRKTRRRHGLPSQPFRFFQNIHRHVLTPNHGCIALVRHAGKPVAGAVFFHSGKVALYKFGASDEKYQHLRANNLAMWEAIKWHAGQGFTALDFGRTSLRNAGLRRFKLGWGTEERRVDYVRFDCRAGHFITAPDEASGWHNRIFKILPESLSGLIGAALYKHVA
jgi:CelD/BcsL family acetyltransferase involved in cellulose biosynthesis